MTTLADLLGRRGRRPPEPMGFARGAAPSERVPDILLLGRIGPSDLPGIGDLRAPLDALVLEMDEPTAGALKSASAALGDALWGVRTASVRSADVDEIKRAGADFVVFDAAGTDGAVLVDEELGKFLSIQTDIDDDSARAVQTLPLDGVAMDIDAALFPLTVESIVRLHGAITSGASAMVFSDFEPGSLSSGDLEALRGCGVSAVALPALGGPEGLGRLAEAIWQLPEPRAVEDERVALVPTAGGAHGPEH